MVVLVGHLGRSFWEVILGGHFGEVVLGGHFGRLFW